MFPSDVASLPQLETLGSSAPLSFAWHVVAEQVRATVAAAPVMGGDSLSASGAAASDGSGAVSASASDAEATVADACDPAAEAAPAPAAASCQQAPAHSEAVLKMLANDIATPTRGLTWKIYCKK